MLPRTLILRWRCCLVSEVAPLEILPKPVDLVAAETLRQRASIETFEGVEPMGSSRGVQVILTPGVKTTLVLQGERHVVQLFTSEHDGLPEMENPQDLLVILGALPRNEVFKQVGDVGKS